MIHELKPENGNEIERPKLPEKNRFDPDKRIDVTQPRNNDVDTSKYDPDKRLANRSVFEGKGDQFRTDTDDVKDFINHESSIEKNVFEKNDIGEVAEICGGSYRDVKKATTESGKEVHHMPADSSNELRREDGPAIRMDASDHRLTASCGNSKEAREYIAKQKELQNQGKWREAMQMDIDDLHSKFGNKYDEAARQCLVYAETIFGGMK